MSARVTATPATFKPRLAGNYRYLKAQLPERVGLPLEDLSTLALAECFPAAECHHSFGPSWDAEEVDAWAWELRNNSELADAVEIILERRDEWWAI